MVLQDEAIRSGKWPVTFPGDRRVFAFLNHTREKFYTARLMVSAYSNILFWLAVLTDGGSEWRGGWLSMAHHGDTTRGEM